MKVFDLASIVLFGMLVFGGLKASEAAKQDGRVKVEAVYNLNK